MFAQVVFACDQYVRVAAPLAQDGSARFFAIASKLPMELQMVLCNRLFGLARDVVLSKFSEPAFRFYAKSYVWRSRK